MAGKRKREAGIGRYLREAFRFRWNLLLLAGSVAAALLSPFPDVLLPLIGAGELAYLTGLISIPRFRQAVDAKAHAAEQRRRTSGGGVPARSLNELLRSLPQDGRRRFERLRERCLEMRAIARGVTGGTAGPDSAVDDLGRSGLDRLLWVFLRLLLSQASLERFLKTTDEDKIALHLEETRTRLADAEQQGDERVVRSLRDSLATSELRLENYRRAEQNTVFVSIELDRLERKIQTLSEMAVNRQDPDFISREVDSVAQSIRETEVAMNELQLVTGLIDDLEQPPPILTPDLPELMHEA